MDQSQACIVPRNEDIENDDVKNYHEQEEEVQFPAPSRSDDNETRSSCSKSDENKIQPFVSQPVKRIGGGKNLSKLRHNNQKKLGEIQKKTSKKTTQRSSASSKTSTSESITMNNISIDCPWPKCSYETKRKWALNEHINLVHTGLKAFECTASGCEQTFHTSYELGAHIKKQHSELASKEFMSCSWPGCDSLFRSKLGLRSHLATHKGEVLIDCSWPGCSFRAKNKRQHENHQRKHTGDRPFQCDFDGSCKATFRTSDSLRHHRKNHLQYRPFLCEWPGCEAKFKTNRGLTVHKALHTGDKVFKCDRDGCDYASERKYNVDMHIYEHHTHIKPYQCTWSGCEASFLRNDKLNNHLKVHRQEKSFKCLECDKYFVEKGNMMKHYHNMHVKK